VPRKPKDAPPPWWVAPLMEWVREVRFALSSNGHFEDDAALKLLVRVRRDEIAKLMRAFTSRAAPPTLPIADSLRAPSKQPPLDRVMLLLPSLREQQRRRAILDDLPVDKRRQICAAGHVLWTAYFAHRHKTQLERGGPQDLNHPGDLVGIKRVTIHDEQEAHAVAVAGKVLGAMKALYGSPRYKLTQSVVKLFTGVEVRPEKLRELWKRFAVVDRDR
jgi:hypothetical protein